MSRYFSMTYPRRVAQEKIGAVIGLQGPIADSTWRKYRQATCLLVEENFIPQRAGKVWGEELAAMMLVAQEKSAGRLEELKKQSLWGDGFPHQAAQQLAKKFGVQIGEIKKNAI